MAASGGINSKKKQQQQRRGMICLGCKLANAIFLKTKCSVQEDYQGKQKNKERERERERERLTASRQEEIYGRLRVGLDMMLTKQWHREQEVSLNNSQRFCLFDLFNTKSLQQTCQGDGGWSGVLAST